MDEKQRKLQPIAKYTWKKGQSGNPAGRPKGKTLKEFAREYLASLPDDEKIDYLTTLPESLVWQMAEGNPENKTKLDVDNTQNFTKEELEAAKQILVNRINKDESNILPKI